MTISRVLKANAFCLRHVRQFRWLVVLLKLTAMRRHRPYIYLSLSLPSLLIYICNDVTMHLPFFSSLFVKIHTFVHCTWIQFNVIVKKQKRKRWFFYRHKKRNARWYLVLILMIMVSSVSRIHGQLRFDYIVYWDSCVFLQIRMFMSRILTCERATRKRKKKKEMAQRVSCCLYWIAYMYTYIEYY